MHERKRFNPRNNNRNRRFDGAQASTQSPRPTHILPSPGILESYEELVPGASKIILEMAKKEQEHRHKLDQENIKAIASIAKRGQMFGLAFAIILVYICAMLIMNGVGLMAVIIAVIGFVGLGLTSMSNKGRNYFRRNHRPNR
jgi:uncharacterized membrane protein